MLCCKGEARSGEYGRNASAGSLSKVGTGERESSGKAIQSMCHLEWL